MPLMLAQRGIGCPVHGQMLQHRQQHSSRILATQVEISGQVTPLDAADQLFQGLLRRPWGKEA